MRNKLFVSARAFFTRLRRDNKGAALVEYALLIAGVALICLVAVSVLGHKTNDLIAAVATILPGAHQDDNGPLISGHLAETKFDGNNVVLDVAGIKAASNTKRLGTNLLGPTGGDLTTLIIDPGTLGTGGGGGGGGGG